jgi:ABC-2 type transport system permease protein
MLVVSDGDIIRNEIIDSAYVNEEWRYKYMPINMDVYGVRNPNGTPKFAYGNRDFVLNSVDYMLDDFSLIDIRTKTITMRVLDTEKVIEEKEFWKFINIAVPLLAILLLAIFQLILRKRKYARTI